MERLGRGQRRARHPLTPDQEHRHLVAGSRLFNAGRFFDCHEEWEEVWRRAAGPRRELLRGLVQLAVGYEHLRRGNHVGARSLLRQAARRLGPHRRLPGVAALVDRAGADLARLGAEPALTLRRLGPPKVMVGLRGFPLPGGPGGAIAVEVPRAAPEVRRGGRGGGS